MSPAAFHGQLAMRSYTFYDRRPQFVRTLTAFNEWVLIGVESGAFDYDTGEEHGQALPGDLVFAAPHRPLWRTATTIPITYHVLQWSFAAPAEQQGEMWQAGKWHVSNAARLMDNYGLLRALFGRHDEFARCRVQSLLQDILLLAYEARHLAPEVSDPTMREALHLLRERTGDAFSMAEVSGAVGLRPVQFTRRFRKAYGVTPIEYLTRLRLESARKLLIETDATLDEIAERCGWSSGYYLSEVFKKAFGTAPGQFRRLHRV